MRIATIYFLIMLYPLIAKNVLLRSRKTWLNWKSRNRQKLTRARAHQRRGDAESSYTYYLPRTINNVALDRINSSSFEDVVLRLKQIGILDLPNVSVVRKLNSYESWNVKKSAISKPLKRCGIVAGSNPCGVCLNSRSEYSIEGAAILRARDFECASYSPCFNARGTCQRLVRYFTLLAKDGDNWLQKTLDIPVACICVR